MLIKKLFPIIVLTFVNTIGFSLMIPVLPGIVGNFGYGTAVYGLLLSIYSLFQFLAAPVLGSLSDKFGRKPMLIISHSGTLLSWFILGSSYFISKEILFFGFPLALIVIIFSRITDGITGGNISIANAYVSDITASQEKSKAYGYVGSAFGFGFIIGPVMGALSASTQFGYLGTTIIAATISVFALVLLFKMTEPNHNSVSFTREIDLLSEVKESLSFINKLKKHRSTKGVIDLLGIRFIYAILFTGYTSIFVILLQDLYKLNTLQTGYFFTVVGFYSIVNQSFVIPKVVHYFGEYKLLFLSVLTTTIGISLIAFHPLLPVFLLIAYLISVGLSGSFISVRTLLNLNSDPTYTGEIIGIDDAIISLNSAYIPFLAGLIYKFTDGYLYLILGGIGLYCLFLTLKLPKKLKILSAKHHLAG